MSLLHSNDVDQVAVQDYAEYDDTGQDWPVKNGYGNLIAHEGRNVPVRLNTPVTGIDYSGSDIALHTARGSLTAEKVVLTVSTGVLAADIICFDPPLPNAKLSAIDALPLGNSNYQIFRLRDDALQDLRQRDIHYSCDGHHMLIRIRQFDLPCVITSTGGRFAWWLEKQGADASREYFEEALVNLFGNDFRREIVQFKVSAWGFDPCIRGAYSSQKPGYRNMRDVLREDIDGRLIFAGEATSKQHLNTAHGAFMEGREAIHRAFGGQS